MTFPKFATAQEVRKFLKGKGFEKVKVRWGDNPFGGEGRFWVSPTDIPEGVACVYSGGSNTPERTFSSDKGVTAGASSSPSLIHACDLVHKWICLAPNRIAYGDSHKPVPKTP